MSAPEPRDPATCLLHDALVKGLDGIGEKLDLIYQRLGTGDVTLATLAIRVKWIERVVFGAVGLTLTAVFVGLLALVIRKG